jgi:nucleoside-diphosphate-sugar epimerase
LGEPITVTVDRSRFRQADKLVQRAAIARLRQLTGWQPEISLRDGLRELLKYEKLLPAK